MLIIKITQTREFLQREREKKIISSFAYCSRTLSSFVPILFSFYLIETLISDLIKLIPSTKLSFFYSNRVILHIIYLILYITTHFSFIHKSYTGKKIQQSHSSFNRSVFSSIYPIKYLVLRIMQRTCDEHYAAA